MHEILWRLGFWTALPLPASDCLERTAMSHIQSPERTIRGRHWFQTTEGRKTDLTCQSDAQEWKRNIFLFTECTLRYKYHISNNVCSCSSSLSRIGDRWLVLSAKKDRKGSEQLCRNLIWHNYWPCISFSSTLLVAVCMCVWRYAYGKEKTRAITCNTVLVLYVLLCQNAGWR